MGQGQGSRGGKGVYNRRLSTFIGLALLLEKTPVMFFIKKLSSEKIKKKGAGV